MTHFGMELRGQRVLLRPATVDDAEAMLAYLGNPVVTHHLTHPPLALHEIRTRLARFDAPIEHVRFNALFAVLLGREAVGEAHAWNIGERDQPASPDPSEVWIGYALNPTYEGRGLASEAVSVLLGWLETRGARSVFANL